MEDHILLVLALSFLSAWNQMPWRSLRIEVSPRNFLHELFREFDGLSESVKLWVVFSESCSDFSREFSFYKSLFFFFFYRIYKKEFCSNFLWRVVAILCSTATLLLARFNTSHCITFTFGLILFGKAWTPTSSSCYWLNSTTTVRLHGWLLH